MSCIYDSIDIVNNSLVYVTFINEDWIINTDNFKKLYKKIEIIPNVLNGNLYILYNNGKKIYKSNEFIGNKNDFIKYIKEEQKKDMSKFHVYHMILENLDKGVY